MVERQRRYKEKKSMKKKVLTFFSNESIQYLTTVLTSSRVFRLRQRLEAWLKKINRKKDDENKRISGAWVHIHKTLFSLQLMNGPNKLECSITVAWKSSHETNSLAYCPFPMLQKMKCCDPVSIFTKLQFLRNL